MTLCACASWRWLDEEQRWQFWPSGTLRRKVKRCGYCGDALNADGTVEKKPGHPALDKRGMKD